MPAQILKTTEIPHTESKWANQAFGSKSVLADSLASQGMRKRQERDLIIGRNLPEDLNWVVPPTAEMDRYPKIS